MNLDGGFYMNIDTLTFLQRRTGTYLGTTLNMSSFHTAHRRMNGSSERIIFFIIYGNSHKHGPCKKTLTLSFKTIDMKCFMSVLLVCTVCSSCTTSITT